MSAYTHNGHGRPTAAPGHFHRCTGASELSIRFEAGLYRVTVTCACGAARRTSPTEYATYGAAEEAVRPLLHARAR